MNSMLYVVALMLAIALPSRGATVGINDGPGALHYELGRAVFDERKADARVLLEDGADPNVVSQRYRLGTPLAWAVIRSSRSRDASLVELLCEYGADPNLRDRERLTPLYRAMVHNALEAAAVLLECGANPNSKNTLETTPFSSAVGSLMAAHAGRDARGPEEYRALIDLMLEHDADPDVRPTSPGGTTPLALAVGLDDVQLVEKLLNAGAPPDVRFGHCAEDEEPCVQFTALKHVFPTRENAAQITILLLSAGADPNIYSVELNPLGYAARWGNVEMVEALIAYGADLKRYGPDALKIAGSQEVKELIRAHMIKLDEGHSE